MIQNDILNRMNMNKNRLFDDLYSYPLVFEQGSSWKGDFEGRAFLALNSLYKAFDGDNKTQKEIMTRIENFYSHIGEYTNKDFYFVKTFICKACNRRKQFLCSRIFGSFEDVLQNTDMT